MRLSGFTNTDMGPSIPSCSSNCIIKSTIAIINSTTKCITCENIGCSTLETTISREAHLKEDYTIQSGFIFLEHSFINSNAGKYQKTKNYLYFAAQIITDYSEWQARSADVLSGWTFCQEDVLSGPP